MTKKPDWEEEFEKMLLDKTAYEQLKDWGDIVEGGDEWAYNAEYDSDDEIVAMKSFIRNLLKQERIACLEMVRDEMEDPSQACCKCGEQMHLHSPQISWFHLNSKIKELKEK